jgi:hypothetical protein
VRRHDLGLLSSPYLVQMIVSSSMHYRATITNSLCFIAELHIIVCIYIYIYTYFIYIYIYIYIFILYIYFFIDSFIVGYLY